MFDKLLLIIDNLKLTPLRKEILKILIQSKKPIGAYEILAKLKNKRKGAEPPTVYRVIDYLLKKNIIHRLEAENKYIFCSQLDNSKASHHGIILVCQTCLASFEVLDEKFTEIVSALSTHHQFSISKFPIEIKGICSSCSVN